MTEENAPQTRAGIKLAELRGAIGHVAAGIDVDDNDGIFAAMTCKEADAVSEMFRVAGHPEAADLVIEKHRTGDDEGDKHGDVQYRVTFAVVDHRGIDYVATTVYERLEYEFEAVSVIAVDTPDD